jgi:hypothetical protein
VIEATKATKATKVIEATKATKVTKGSKESLPNAGCAQTTATVVQTNPVTRLIPSIHVNISLEFMMQLGVTARARASIIPQGQDQPWFPVGSV